LRLALGTGDEKAIRSLRLRLRSGLRQSGVRPSNEGFMARLKSGPSGVGFGLRFVPRIPHLKVEI
jgi:hypothetical protein